MGLQQSLAVWHEQVTDPSGEKLLAQLADDAVFHSPVVHTPQQGKPLVFAYLNAASSTFEGTDFHYVDEILDELGNKAML